MESVDRFFFYMFILSLALILVAFWAGTQADASAIGTQLQSLFLIGQGRVPGSGQFANYPGGAPGPGGTPAAS